MADSWDTMGLFIPAAMPASVSHGKTAVVYVGLLGFGKASITTEIFAL
jgi:hypothetical protein